MFQNKIKTKQFDDWRGKMYLSLKVLFEDIFIIVDSGILPKMKY